MRQRSRSVHEHVWPSVSLAGNKSLLSVPRGPCTFAMHSWHKPRDNRSLVLGYILYYKIVGWTKKREDISWKRSQCCMVNIVDLSLSINVP